MAVTSFDPRNPQIQLSGSSIPQIIYGVKEAASQSFKAGQFVVLASGLVSIMPDSSGGDNAPLGVALKDGTTESSASLAIEIPIQVIDPNTEVLITVADTSGTVEASNTACVIGASYDLQRVSTNLDYINSGDTGNPTFIYVGPVLNAAGTASNQGRFRLLAAQNALMLE